MSDFLVAVMGRGVLQAEAAVIPADDLGFTRGDGCFDSARVVDGESGARVVNLPEHLGRLERSAELLGIACPAREQWQRLVDEALAAWGGRGEATLKLYLTRGREWDRDAGPLALLTIAARPEAPTGSRALTATLLTTGRPADAFRDAPWLLGGVKTLSYAIQAASVREARARGVDDAILVTTDGYALEGTTSGLIVVTDGVVRTPPTGDTGILESTTVADLLAAASAARMPTATELIPVDDLFAADGVFLVSSSRGPCPVTRIDDRDLAVDAALVARVTELAGF